MEKDILARLEKVEKQHKNLKSISFGSILILLLAVIYLANTQSDRSPLIRTQGIIIEDENGKDRILIGAPIPYSKERVRTDTAMVRKHWASRIFPNDPDRYMGYYKDYYNATNGMVIMNEDGFDRVLLGDKLADPNTGKRLFEAAGITWNTKEGFELGGAGVNTAEDGTARSVIGLDGSEGEAVHLVALEDGTKALIIGGKDGRLMIGMANEKGNWFQNEDKFAGIKFFDNEGKLVWEQKMNSEKKE